MEPQIKEELANRNREANYTNYMRTLTIVDSLFQGIQLKHLDDIVM